MGIIKNIENAVQRWLFKEEIEAHEQETDGRVPRPEPSEAEILAQIQQEVERVKEIQEREVARIKKEDHSKPPTDEDILRYHEYHSNMIDNIKVIRETTGQEPPWNVPSEPTDFNEYKRIAGQEGWKYLRMSCGLPTGDLNKPKKPWTMADSEKKWKVEDEPEIHWKSDD